MYLLTLAFTTSTPAKSTIGSVGGTGLIGPGFEGKDATLGLGRLMLVLQYNYAYPIIEQYFSTSHPDLFGQTSL